MAGAAVLAYASGSGIPQVEAALTGDLPPAPPRLIPVKFAGGVLAMAPAWHWAAKGRACRWERSLPI